MLQIYDIQTHNFEAAIRGMRNPMDSWDKSDSKWVYNDILDKKTYLIGDNDLELAKRLCKAGTEHRKFLRQIFVSYDIIAPIYFYKEFDTYKINTTSNSCSTMHTIHKKDFTLDDFSIEHLTSDNKNYYISELIPRLNTYRQKYVESKDKNDWWQLIQLLPTSFNQRRTISMNYENILNILHQRKNHKLDEWYTFCDTMLYTLPYIDEFYYSSKEGE